jgi:lipoate-protein ligase A
MLRQWRLITDKPMNGAQNMARDEAIMNAVAKNDISPTLRLYAWRPPCLSLGYGQRQTSVDFARVASAGWQVVRRPTGGQAILHTDELTYSVAMPADHPLASATVIDSYRRISQALQAGLVRLGLKPQAEYATEMRSTKGPVCFEVPSHYEITAGGRKLVGSAQVRRKSSVLQHGTLPLCGDVARICDGLIYSEESDRQRAKMTVRARATTLEAALGNPVTWEQAAEAIVQGFSEMFEIDFVKSDLLDTEQTQAAALETEKYANPEWTGRW